MAGIGDGRLVLGAVAGPFPALLTHDSLHGAASDVVALAAKPDPQLARSQGLHEPAGLLVLPLGADQGDEVGVGQLPLRGLLVDPLVVGRGADLDAVLGQHGAHGLDTSGQPGLAVRAALLVVLVLGDEPGHRFSGRSSSAAKKAEAAFKMAFARRSSAFSRFNRLISAESSDVTPGLAPASTSACRHHFRTVSAVPTPSSSGPEPSRPSPTRAHRGSHPPSEPP